MATLIERMANRKATAIAQVRAMNAIRTIAPEHPAKVAPVYTARSSRSVAVTCDRCGMGWSFPHGFSELPAHDADDCRPDIRRIC